MDADLHIYLKLLNLLEAGERIYKFGAGLTLNPDGLVFKFLKEW